MAELLPVAQAESLRAHLLEYLGTTFSLADPATRSALEDFLRAPDTGLFRGPYLRLRLPFRAATDGWRDALEWHEGYPPYGHQAAAFRRLSSLAPDGGLRRPDPTLVTTGTGSGKTESFLYPILDHVLRANRTGVHGTKAIILYPMNALANDQAKRLTELLSEHEALAGVTAALYTGQQGTQRTRVSAAGLITSREIIRDSPPDILLTNYKMLDQLLLRPADARIWSASARSLQYLVLDEFHTYDGAQGTDVAMLLRRLGLALKSHWPSGEAERVAAGIAADDAARPLGQVTPVATSATLGDKGDPSTMLEFARTVFGEDFGADAVVTESRLPIDEWVGSAPEVVAARGWLPVEVDSPVVDQLLAALDAVDEDPSTVARLVLAHLYRIPLGRPAPGDPVLTDWPVPNLQDDSPTGLLALARAHPLVQILAVHAQDAVELSQLASDVLPTIDGRRAERLLTAIVSSLSHLRATCGREAMSVDVHLWTRELTRVNRRAGNAAHFRWGDDGVLAADPTEGEESTYLPAVYCRHCGRSGWGLMLAPTGADLDPDQSETRGRHARRDDRFRALVHAPEEGRRAEEGEHVDGLWWYRVPQRLLVSQRPTDDEDALPVLAHRTDDLGGRPSSDDDCPSCGQADGIRFLGSAIATLLSVALSTLFGAQDLDPAEKKALVFTDSVQDAAHRAGFVQARSHVLTLRSVLRQALADGPADLIELVDRVLAQAGGDVRRRYRLLPPNDADREVYAAFWHADAKASAKGTATKRVKKRLALDALLEHGLRSSVGRTLEATGTAVSEVRVPEHLLLRSARAASEEVGIQGVLDGFAPTDRQIIAWARGVLERMRLRGAIGHDWFNRFREEDGSRFRIWGGRPRWEGMPAFPRGASAPAYPRVGGTPVKDADLEPVADSRGWYAAWAAGCLNVDKNTGAVLSRILFQHLDRAEIIGHLLTQSGGTTYHLDPHDVVVSPVADADLAAGEVCLICSVCGSPLPTTTTVVDQLDGAPCLVARCAGTLSKHSLPASNFYRAMYAGSDPARVVAREHTSMLADDVRLSYENGFKAKEPAPDAPNVLVATPTLEMGIDIGDLSAVMLSSLPRSVASYLQRVGRAGRLTGNALALAFVTARGDQLPRFANPLSVVNGAVRPPATYLDAEEILRRQYIAALADVVARTANAPHPRNARQALGSSASGTYLNAIITLADVGTHLAAFLSGFATLSPAVRDRLRDWATPVTDPTSGASVPSELTRRLHEASLAWQDRLETLNHREKEIQRAVPELQLRAESPAHTKDDEQSLRTAQAALRLVQRQRADLTGEHWVAALEEFGLLPNYTLLDDSVTLEVSLSWIDPDSQEYQNERMELTRGSAQALRDFAPGAVFYARGYAIEIDALDLGRGDDAIRRWVCCPVCGYTQDLTAGTSVPSDGADLASGPAACPRCGDHGIADVAQRVDVVELKRVSSVIRREEATIDDRRDERDQSSWTIRTLADVDPEATSQQWFVDGYGFGARYQRGMHVRWLNLGRASTQGQSIRLAGQEADVAMFRVCESCGKLDTSTSVNIAAEHRPWCPLRKAQTERTRTLALSRSLTTEGLVLRLPESVTVGDDFSLPSLRAALLLALQLRIGGEPDHLAVAAIVDPSPVAGATADALLLHDIVPGGTGYLAELADPDTVWAMLRAAWDYLQQCACKDEGRLACERCLLPYAGSRETQLVSRSAAVRHLHAILLGEAQPSADVEVPAANPWRVSADEPESADPETQLEQLFRKTFRERLKHLGATVTEQPGPTGNAWVIGMPGGASWRLVPQEYLHGTRPDFVLYYDRPGVPPTAIFTDGWRFHASPTVNRLADDAEKRGRLRDAGFQVLSFVWEDLARHGDNAAPSGTAVPWLAAEAPGLVLAAAKDQLSPAMVGLVSAPPLDLLLAWIQDPDVERRTQLARWLALLMAPSMSGGMTAADKSMAEIALDALDGGGLPSGPVFGGVGSHGSLGLGVRDIGMGTYEVAVVLDDATDAVGHDHKTAWREWLRLSNLLNFRNEIPTTITTRSLILRAADTSAGSPEGSSAVTQASVASDVERHLAEAWQPLLAEASEDERRILGGLADLSHRLPTPTVGDEVGDGISLSVSWPTLHLTVRHSYLDDDALAWLDADGWTVVEPDLTALTSILKEATA
ncbi:DEAD/DEAH box helicase [Promicromonospora sukumoe]|uniref:DEAD/DEAH box helicase n=1 Tax=Promicromonospora sukumoe TaxID=88382 RepID=UPI0037C912C9